MASKDNNDGTGWKRAVSPLAATMMMIRLQCRKWPACKDRAANSLLLLLLTKSSVHHRRCLRRPYRSHLPLHLPTDGIGRFRHNSSIVPMNSIPISSFDPLRFLRLPPSTPPTATVLALSTSSDESTQIHTYSVQHRHGLIVVDIVVLTQEAADTGRLWRMG